MTEGSSDEDQRDGEDLEGTISWRELLAEAIDALGRVEGVEAPDLEGRWIVEEASGLEGAEWVLGLDDLATQRGVAHLDAMLQRRAGGAPIQYVLGHWPFRTLDLLVDERVLIPRPETEQVVEVAVDGVQRSTRYPGGVALRFARVVRYRDDKAPDDADPIDAVRALLPD